MYCNKGTAYNSNTDKCLGIPVSHLVTGGLVYYTPDDGFSFIVLFCDNTDGYQ